MAGTLLWAVMFSGDAAHARRKKASEVSTPLSRSRPTSDAAGPQPWPPACRRQRPAGAGAAAVAAGRLPNRGPARPAGPAGPPAHTLLAPCTPSRTPLLPASSQELAVQVVPAAQAAEQQQQQQQQHGGPLQQLGRQLQQVGFQIKDTSHWWAAASAIQHAPRARPARLHKLLPPLPRLLRAAVGTGGPARLTRPAQAPATSSFAAAGWSAAAPASSSRWAAPAGG